MDEKNKRWIPIIQIILAIIGILCTSSIALYFLPNLTSQTSHQNTLDFLKTQVPAAQDYERRGQFKEAIDVYEKCLDRISIKEFREEYAFFNLVLGQDYGFLSEQENKNKNLQNSIDAYKRALDIFNFDNYPIENIAINSGLGTNYLEMSEYFNRRENLENAILSFNKAEKGIQEVYENKQVPSHVRILDFQGLAYITPNEFNTKIPNFGVAYLNAPQYIYTEVDLARAYHDLRILTKNSTYYNLSLNSLNNALAARVSLDNDSPPVSEKSDPNAYALVMLHYGKNVDGFENQMNAYNDSLQILTPQTNKQLYSELQKGIGDSYIQEYPNNLTNIERSIQHYKLALVYTDRNNKFEYGKILKKLGYSYADLATIKNKEENFENAKQTYDEYFTIYTSEYPILYVDAKADIVVLYTMVRDVKNNRTDYVTAQDAFDIAKANNMWNNYPDYESFLNDYLSKK